MNQQCSVYLNRKGLTSSGLIRSASNLLIANCNNANNNNNNKLMRCMFVSIPNRSFEKIRIYEKCNNNITTILNQRNTQMMMMTGNKNLLLSSSFSSTATSATSTVPKTTPPSNSNVFLDNIGTIFLSFIGLVIGSLIRSHYGTVNKNSIRDIIEEESVLDPIELDELRKANINIMDIHLFNNIHNELINVAKNKSSLNNDPNNNNNNNNQLLLLNYIEFVTTVRSVMTRNKGETCTIQLGNLLDRVVLGAFDRHGLSNDIDMPIPFWIVLLSMTLNCHVNDRIRLLYESMKHPTRTTTTTVGDFLDNDTNNNNNDNNNNNELKHNNNEKEVNINDVINIIGYLQDTCQLTPDGQVITTSTKYPVQQYERGKPNQLVIWNSDTTKENDKEEKKNDTIISSSSNNNNNNECIDLDAFASILRTKSVCAWGECYNRNKDIINIQRSHSIIRP